MQSNALVATSTRLTHVLTKTAQKKKKAIWNIGCTTLPRAIPKAPPYITPPSPLPPPPGGMLCHFA